MKYAGWKTHPTQIAQILLIAYSVVLTFRGTASLQSALLLSAFVLLLWERRISLKTSWLEARWLLGPLLIFSIWIFAICAFWREPELLPWFPGDQSMSQPWFSLDQWRRDIGQPMIALLCGFWAFREETWKRRLFAAQAVLILVLVVQCLKQFHVGELIVDGPMRPDVNYWFKGTLWVRGFSHDNIFFAYVLFLLTPGALWLVLERKPGWQGWLRIGILILLFYLIFLNKRRGTWAAVYVEVFLLAAWMGRRHLCVFLVATLLFGLTAYHLRPHWFIRDYDLEPAPRVEGRLKINRDLAGLLDEHPWVGVGFGKDTVVKNYWRFIYQHAHNTFGNLALEVGWPGLAIWLLGLGVYAARFWKNRHNGWAEKIGLALLLGFCIRNFTDDIWISSVAELFWFLIGVFMPLKMKNTS